MSRRLLCSPTLIVLVLLNIVVISLLVSNEIARNAIVDQINANNLLSPHKWTLGGPTSNEDLIIDPAKPPQPVYVTKASVVHATETVTETATATETATSTVTATQTVEVPQAKLDGLPGFCDECGPEDKMCATYGLANLARSRAYEGPNTRLRRVLQKAADGQPLKIGILGGSVSAGHGVIAPDAWVEIFFQWWRTTFPHEKNVFINGAVPATTTDYFSVCALEHIDEDMDLIIVELAINDQRLEFFAKSYEWLIRLLIDLPNKPAVINTQIMALAFDTISMGGDLHLGVSQYYDIPTIDLRNVELWHILENPHLDRDLFARLPPFTPESETDLRHINKVGHKLLADFVIAYIQRQICIQAKLHRNPSLLDFKPQQHYIPGPEGYGEMPRLRMFQKYVHEERVQTIRTSCLSTRTKKHPLVPVRQTGWTEWAWKDKAYVIAKEPGARATFAITAGAQGFIKIVYLRSKMFGLGSVKCWVDDNEAAAVRADGYWEEQGLNIARTADIAYGVPAGPHEVTCEVLQETKDPGGGHEFRMISLTSS